MVGMPVSACRSPSPTTAASGGRRKLHLALLTLASMIAASCGGGGSDEPPRPRAEGSIHRFTAPAGACPANVFV